MRMCMERDSVYMEQEGQEPVRVRIPKGREVFGEVEELLGASRFRIKCADGKTRLCRIPGKFRKRIRISVGDVVIVKPWEVESDSKGDVEWIYNKTQAAWLRKKGFVK